MESGIQIAIDHERDIIESAQKVLKLIKTFTSTNEEVTKNIDICSDELSKIIASSDLFIRILSNSNSYKQE